MKEMNWRTINMYLPKMIEIGKIQEQGDFASIRES